MKVLVLLVLVGFAARMNAFSCSDDCLSSLEGPYCISNGSVVCDNCVRDRMLCQDYSLTSSDCYSACD